MRFLRFIPAVLLCGGAGLPAAAWFGLLPPGTPLDYFAPGPSFVRRWTHKLQACRDEAEAAWTVEKNKEGGKVFKLSDGSWIAVVMEHDCCTGAGFNATLYMTSDGQAWLDSESCYCGFIPLGDELYTYSRKNIAIFPASVRGNGKTLISP